MGNTAILSIFQGQLGVLLLFLKEKSIQVIDWKTDLC